MALNSTSIIKIVDLLCEGEIQGIVGEKKGIFLDETPVRTKTKDNFTEDEVKFEQRFGTQEQDSIHAHSKYNSNVITINEEVGANYSETLDAKNQVKNRDYGGGKKIVRVTDPDTDAIQLLFTVPALFSTGMEGVTRGQLFNATINIEIKIKGVDTGKINTKTFSIKGISTSNYQQKVGISTLNIGTPPFDITVKKVVTKKENDYEVQFAKFTDIPKTTPLGNTRANRLILTAIIEKQKIRTSYPYTACVGLELSTEIFPSLPSRAYLVKGTKVKIPHNAVPRTDGSLEFIEAFNGSLKETKEYTTCPVCIFYDILTNKRYGCGEFIDESNLNWVDLYPLAVYANQLVSTPDGDEPRFAVNTVIGSQAEAYRVLQNLASVFRGMTYWGSNTVNVVADHGLSQQINESKSVHVQHEAQDPVHLYNNSNVIGGVFSYKGSSLKTRSSSIWVSYNDPDNFYKPNVVVVEDYDLIDKYGYNIKKIIAFGCSSKYQAQRMGQWVLNSEKLDSFTITFATGLDGLAVLPGQIFAVSDEMRAGVRLAGRLKSGSTTSSINTDTNYFTSLGSSPEADISVTLSNGTVEKQSISSVSEGGAISVSTAFTSVPEQDSVYIIQRTTVKFQKFKCVDVKDNNDATYTITGLEHNHTLYDVVDNTTNEKAKLDYEDVTAFNDDPSRPEDLNVTATLVQQQAQQQIRLIFSWSRGINASSVNFTVRYKKIDESFTSVNTDSTIFELDDVSPESEYFFEVAANRTVGTDASSGFAKHGGFVVPTKNSLKSVAVPDPLP